MGDTSAGGSGREPRVPHWPDPDRLTEDDSERHGAKLGTRSTGLWIYEKDIPFAVGDVIRYAKREGQCKRGKVVAVRRGKPFIGVDTVAPVLDNIGEGVYPPGADLEIPEPYNTDS